MKLRKIFAHDRGSLTLRRAWFGAALVALLLFERAHAQDQAPASTPPAQSSFLPRYAHRGPTPSIFSQLRLDANASGMNAAAALLTGSGQPKVLALPPHLGGGYVFYQAVSAQGQSATNIYRSTTFSGALTPLAQLPFAVLDMHAGFDRLVILGTGVKLALDPETGDVLPLDPLPPVVTLQRVAFAGSRRALLSAPLVGVLATSDAGLTWRPLPAVESIEGSRGDELLVKADGRTLQVGPQLELVPPRSASQANAARLAWESHVSQLGFSSVDDWGNSLSIALSRGVSVGKQIVALDHGYLIVARAEDSYEVARQPAPAENVSCLGVPDGAVAALFLCRGAQITLFRYSAGQLSQVYQAPRSSANTTSARELLTFGPGAFLLSGDCQRPGAAEHTRGPFCHVSARGARSLMALPVSRDSKRPDPPARYVSFAVDERAAFRLHWRQPERAFVVDALVTASALPSGEAGKQASFAVTTQESLLPLLQSGALLPHAQRDQDGFLVWVAQGEKFVGVRLLSTGGLDYGAVQRPLSRALFYGKKALVWGASGFAKQSTDGGLHFEDLTLPYRSGDPELSAPLDRHTSTLMGCGDAGCVLGHWLKRGWLAPDPEDLPVVPRKAVPPPGGGRHHFSCGLHGTASPIKRSDPASAFESFWEQRPPHLPANYLGTSLGFPHDVARLYAYGPKDVPWNRDGRLELWYLDPFDAHAVHKSQATGHMVGNFAAAEGLLGVDQGSALGELVLDPDAIHGVVVVRARQRESVFTVKQNQPLAVVPLVDTRSGQEIELKTLRGAVYARGHYYLGFTFARDQLAVARLDASGFTLIAVLPVGDAQARFHALVRSTSGDLGVAMEGDAGLFVYPLHVDGHLDGPLIAAHQSRRHAACAPEAFGFIVDWELPLSPYLETLQEEPLKVNGLLARVLVYPQGTCLDSMSARVRAVPPLSRAEPATDSVALVLQNADSNGSRIPLLCR